MLVLCSQNLSFECDIRSYFAPNLEALHELTVLGLKSRRFFFFPINDFIETSCFVYPLRHRSQYQSHKRSPVLFFFQYIHLNIWGYLARWWKSKLLLKSDFLKRNPKSEENKKEETAKGKKRMVGVDGEGEWGISSKCKPRNNRRRRR